MIHGCGAIHGGGVILISRGWLPSGSRYGPFAIRVAVLGVPIAVIISAVEAGSYLAIITGSYLVIRGAI